MAELKSEAGNDLLVIGSTELAAGLLKHELVDEIRLMIDPVMLDSGKRFFRDDRVCRRLALVTSEMTSTGASQARLQTIGSLHRHRSAYWK
jgi:dihydrofolate reductase